MANAQLTAIEIERFKSYRKRTRVELAPLTVLLGRNNSGKSTLIQALLLLKQTLALPRPEVPLHLEGVVDAFSLRELTSGWPEGPEIQGPSLSLEWTSTVDVIDAIDQAKTLSEPSYELENDTGVKYTPMIREVKTRLDLDYRDSHGKVILQTIKLSSLMEDVRPVIILEHQDQPPGQYRCFWHSNRWNEPQLADKILIELDHFLPYLLLKNRNVGTKDEQQRAWYTAFLILFAQPLDDLKKLLTNFSYLGSVRTLPPSVYRPATVPPEDIGVSGEYAAQLLHARRSDAVHYLPPLQLSSDEVIIPDTVREESLVSSVNDVMQSLGVDVSLNIEDVRDIGFRLLFGRANLQHVGRGLSYLLPVIQLGLLADPLRFKPTGDISLEDYLRRCSSYGHCALEEPEAHLHPKIQTRLAHWLVSLAMARRQFLVETHSDHLVRRLRGLMARAGAGSDLERWLLENVRILQVEQNEAGESEVEAAHLTTRGGLEDWPSDFMDEATGEERSIYHAALDKPDEATEESPPSDPSPVEHDVGEEPEP